MQPDVALDDLRHQAVERPSACGKRPQNILALVFFLESSADPAQLPLDATNSVEEFLLIAKGMLSATA